MNIEQAKKQAAIKDKDFKVGEISRSLICTIHGIVLYRA